MIHRRASVFAAVLVAAAAVACASAPGPRPAPAAASAGPRAAVVGEASIAGPRADPVGLSFSVDPPDAEVLVDGRSCGKAGELARSGLPLPPGLYQVSLRRAGYATWRAEVAVRGGLEPIRVTLSRTAPVP
jgi:hypothetical protein